MYVRACVCVCVCSVRACVRARVYKLEAPNSSTQSHQCALNANAWHPGHPSGKRPVHTSHAAVQTNARAQATGPHAPQGPPPREAAHLSRVETLQIEQLPLGASDTSIVVCTTLRALGPSGDVSSRDDVRAGWPAASASLDSCGGKFGGLQRGPRHGEGGAGRRPLQMAAAARQRPQARRVLRPLRESPKPMMLRSSRMFYEPRPLTGW